MSGLLAGKIWLSDLHPDLKPLAATLADIANDDGSHIFPTVDYVAWRLSRNRATVMRGLSELRRLGVLTVVLRGGGRGQSTEYRLLEDKLPQRTSWSNIGVNGRIMRPITGRRNGRINDTKRSHKRHETVALTTFERDVSITNRHYPLLPVRENPAHNPRGIPPPVENFSKLPKRQRQEIVAKRVEKHFEHKKEKSDRAKIAARDKRLAVQSMGELQTAVKNLARSKTL